MRPIKSYIVLFLTAAMLTVPACSQIPPDLAGSPRGEVKVLFIGNSFTHYNNLPGMLEALAGSPESPRRIQASASTIPAVGLEQLWTAGRALAAIRREHWDYVILQPSHADPANPPGISVSLTRI